MKLLIGSLAMLPALFARSAWAQDASTPTSGGLAPPPAIEAEPPPVAPTETERELDTADKKDSGRGLEFVWLNAEVGAQHLGLQTFHANQLVDAQLVDSTQTGPVYGVGAGVRLIFLTAGARFRLATFSSWDLWTLNAELGLRIPLGALEPYFTFGGGYASLGSFDSSKLSSAFGGAANSLDVHGFDVRAGFGLDYYFGHHFSLGANVTGDALFLSRSKLNANASANASQQNPQAAAIYAQDGSSIGGSVTLTAVVGLHF